MLENRKKNLFFTRSVYCRIDFPFHVKFAVMRYFTFIIIFYGIDKWNDCIVV